MRSDLCVKLWLLSDCLCRQTSHWIIIINGKMKVWKCKLIFPIDTLQQNIEIADLKKKRASENTSEGVCVCVCVCVYIYIFPHFFTM